MALRTSTALIQKPQKKVVTDADFGFGSSDESDQENEEEDENDEAGYMNQIMANEQNIGDGNGVKRETPALSENKFVQSDIDKLSSLCAGLNAEIDRMEELNKQQNSPKKTRKSTNVF